MFLIFFLLGVPFLLSSIEFIGFLISGKRTLPLVLLRLNELGAMIILPLMYGNFGVDNNCCGEDLDTAVFAPDHQLTILCIIVLSLVAYTYSTFRKKTGTPVLEVCTNAFLLIGIALNIAIGIHTNAIWLALGGNLPIILLAIMALYNNHQLFMIENKNTSHQVLNKTEKYAWNFLNLNPFLKFPLLLLICLPLMVVITSFLILFGQKPDSIIHAFTDTYKHGFSQWDYQCENVSCGGHFLCSVAANGHARIVKPERLGVRNGHTIVCNRQLLIANAFEELIQDWLPTVHSKIRKNYNRVGLLVHRYYGVFNNKYISDVLYIVMKPLEWIFLITLYTFDKDPETRISKQYLSTKDKSEILKHSKNISTQSI
jgi:hypothetical protein